MGRVAVLLKSTDFSDRVVPTNPQGLKPEYAYIQLCFVTLLHHGQVADYNMTRLWRVYT